MTQRPSGDTFGRGMYQNDSADAVRCRADVAAVMREAPDDGVGARRRIGLHRDDLVVPRAPGVSDVGPCGRVPLMNGISRSGRALFHVA